MKPIGLILKNIKENPFTGRITGEPMIVHLCLNCGRISWNRIAGDDHPSTLISLLEEPSKLNIETTNNIANLGIKLLTQEDKQEVFVTLYGYHY